MPPSTAAITPTRTKRGGPGGHFLTTRAEFAAWAQGRTVLRMEHCYPTMRRRYGLLVDTQGKPEGGKWSFDTENRGHARHVEAPAIPWFTPDAITQSAVRFAARSPHHARYRPGHRSDRAVSRSVRLVAARRRVLRGSRAPAAWRNPCRSSSRATSGGATGWRRSHAARERRARRQPRQAPSRGGPAGIARATNPPVGGLQPPLGRSSAFGRWRSIDMAAAITMTLTDAEHIGGASG